MMSLPSLHGLSSVTAEDVQAAGWGLRLAVRQWTVPRRDGRTVTVSGSPSGIMAAVARLAGSPAAPAAADAADSGDDRLAEKVFRDTLLSAPGGEFALEPPDTPGALLSQACLFLT